MPLGIGGLKSFNAIRCETRVPMEVGVHISGHSAHPGTETTFTENVSARGARVVSTRKWKINDRLIVTSQPQIEFKTVDMRGATRPLKCKHRIFRP